MLIDEYYIIESTKDSCLFSWDQKSNEYNKGAPVKINGFVVEMINFCNLLIFNRNKKCTCI